MTKLKNVAAMKGQLSTDSEEFIQQAEFSFGYIQPGHGARGKQKSLSESEDLIHVYSIQEIILWLEVTRSKFQKATWRESKIQCYTYHEGHSKISQVPIIVDELDE